MESEGDIEQYCSSPEPREPENGSLPPARVDGPTPATPEVGTCYRSRSLNLPIFVALHQPAGHL